MAFDFPPGVEGLEFTPVSGLTYKYTTNRWVVKSQLNPMSVLVVSDTPPASPAHGQLWWESDSGALFIWYNDGNSSQWVQVNVPSDFGNFVNKTGDTMSGDLTIAKSLPVLNLNRTDPSQGSRLLGSLNGVGRWNISLGNPVAETGGNVGSDFAISRWTDAGVMLDSPIAIARSSGLVSLAKGQLQFPATANPSSDPNTLDDYLEGTWVPNLMVGGSAAGITYSSRIGYYRKIGSVVFVGMDITLSSKGAGSGTIDIGGFPYSVGLVVMGGAIGDYSGVTLPVNTMLLAPMAGTGFGMATTLAAGTGSGRLLNTHISNTTMLKVSGVFFTP